MDNKQSIENLIGQQIDPNGTPGSILAENHRDRLIEVLKTAGKYTGNYYLAEKERTSYPAGTFSWNNNSLDQQNDFDVIISKKSSDLVDLGIIFGLMSGDLALQIKDYIGRTSLYKIKDIQPDTIGVDDVYKITLNSLAGNPSYIYQANEKLICGISFIFLSTSDQIISVGGVDYFFKKKGTTGTVQQPEQYDIGEHGIREVTEDGQTFKVVQSIIYNTGTVGDINSWEILTENEISF